MDDLGQFRVAGISHYQSAAARCAPGQAVTFAHEPDNPHDEQAIRVISLAGETIGYVPRRSWVHEMVHQNGRGIAGVIASAGMARNGMIGMTISAAITDDAPSVTSYYPGEAAPEPPVGGFRYWVRTPADVGRLVAGRR